MPGFLDRRDTIVDMVLTHEGMRLMSRGELRFVYYSFFDDEVDYAPYVAGSASLSAEQLSGSWVSQTEASFIREASRGRITPASDMRDGTAVSSRIFTTPPGLGYVPRMSVSPSSSISVQTKQRKYSETFTTVDSAGKVVKTRGPIERGYQRYETTVVDVATAVPGTTEGFLLRVFRSSSDGLVELDGRQDENGYLAYSNDVRVIER